MKTYYALQSLYIFTFCPILSYPLHPITVCQILARLNDLYDMLGSPYDLNEMQYSVKIGKIIGQLEIYDRVWTSQDMKNAVSINSHLHSKKGIELARKIVEILFQDEGNAECFPYCVIEDLKTEFGLE